MHHIWQIGTTILEKPSFSIYTNVLEEPPVSIFITMEDGYSRCVQKFDLPDYLASHPKPKP
jgi:hypothetical protein